MERGCQSNDRTLADGYRHAHAAGSHAQAAHGTKEMMQHCLIYPHVISLVVCRWQQRAIRVLLSCARLQVPQCGCRGARAGAVGAGGGGRRDASAAGDRTAYSCGHAADGIQPQAYSCRHTAAGIQPQLCTPCVSPLANPITNRLTVAPVATRTSCIPGHPEHCRIILQCRARGGTKEMINPV